jgi:hypothetical protein
VTSSSRRASWVRRRAAPAWTASADFMERGPGSAIRLRSPQDVAERTGAANAWQGFSPPGFPVGALGASPEYGCHFDRPRARDPVPKWDVSGSQTFPVALIVDASLGSRRHKDDRPQETLRLLPTQRAAGLVQAVACLSRRAPRDDDAEAQDHGDEVGGLAGGGAGRSPSRSASRNGLSNPPGT